MAATQRLSRTGLESDAERFADEIVRHLTCSVGTARNAATDRDWLQAVSLAVRDRVVERRAASDGQRDSEATKHVYYLSIEFLIGRLLFDALTNLRLMDTARKALSALDIDFDRLRRLEPDPALGNGGLGRLAACYLDSMSSLGIAAVGYGIRYEQGLFRQRFENGRQIESPDDWLASGNPWEFPRADARYEIQFGGSVEPAGDASPEAPGIWRSAERVVAAAFDTPIAGWRGRRVNTLRLWSARAAEPIDLGLFNQGDHAGAMTAQVRASAISRVLYPSDATPAGAELRLRQEYFFTSAALQDIVRRHVGRFGDLSTLPDRAAIQLNDTHPAIAVAELMRILIDRHGVAWNEAWAITCATLSYTNHTLLPEALETWPTDLLGRLLPRHLQIICQINAHHLNEARRAGVDDVAAVARLSLIDEAGVQRVRMGHLAFVGSHAVNGVSALHTELMKQTTFRDLATLYPGRVQNKTNGITFRRWLYEANPALTSLIVERLGPAVLDNPASLQNLARFADDRDFIEAAAAIRRDHKQGLVRRIRAETGYEVTPDALFDVHIKRIHEYKRQLLNIIETVALFQAIRAEPDAEWTPRVKLFAGKAAPSYDRAKLIIELINNVARVVNSDSIVGDRLKVAFLPNYNVSLAEDIIPASDLSEQISTAGMEASGTGNMKLALNGALTIGTMDGANIEIRSAVGEDNIVIFGLTADEVQQRRASRFTGRDAVSASPRLKAALDAIAAGDFCPDEPARYRALVEAVLDFDPFMVAADFESYWTAQRRIETLWRDPAAWWRRSILNTAKMGWFSSDRAIREYAADIWRVETRTPGSS